MGLDPHEKELPEDTPAAAQAFCEQLIEATHEVCCCYKPNAAFFEQHGPAGVEALHAVIKMCQVCNLYCWSDLQVFKFCVQGSIMLCSLSRTYWYV